MKPPFGIIFLKLFFSGHRHLRSKSKWKVVTFQDPSNLEALVPWEKLRKVVRMVAILALLCTSMYHIYNFIKIYLYYYTACIILYIYALISI